MREIVVKHEGGLYKLEDGEMVCQHIHVETEPYTLYQPSQEEIDLGTDHDVYMEGLVCVDCGEQLHLYA